MFIFKALYIIFVAHSLSIPSRASGPVPDPKTPKPAQVPACSPRLEQRAIQGQGPAMEQLLLGKPFNRENLTYGPLEIERRLKETGLIHEGDLDEALSHFPLDRMGYWHFLEVGGGRGRVAERLLKEFPNCRVTIVEHNPKSVKFMTDEVFIKDGQPNPRVTILQGSTYTIELPAHGFDGIFAMHSFLPEGSLGEQFEFLKIARAALRPGRMLLADIPDAAAFTEAEGVKDQFGEWNLKMVDGTPYVFKNYLSTPDQLLELARRAGFDIDSPLSLSKRYTPPPPAPDPTRKDVYISRARYCLVYVNP